jgi:hypothetical protein
MIDIAKIKAQGAKIKAMISGKPYVAPVAHVEPVVVPEIPVEPEVVHVQPEVQPEPEVVQEEPAQEYPLNQD